jgi:hypothetical protein
VLDMHPDAAPHTRAKRATMMTGRFSICGLE